MKILMTILAAVLALALTAQAQTTDKNPQTAQQPAQADAQMQMGCRMMGGSGMAGGGMMCGKMGGMMGCMKSHGAITHDLLDVVTEMLKMQQKLVEGVKPAEKESLLKEIARLQGRVEQMQSTAHTMPMMHSMPMDHSSPQQGKPEPGKEAPKTQMQHQH